MLPLLHWEIIGSPKGAVSWNPILKGPVLVIKSRVWWNSPSLRSLASPWWKSGGSGKKLAIDRSPAVSPFSNRGFLVNDVVHFSPSNRRKVGHQRSFWGFSLGHSDFFPFFIRSSELSTEACNWRLEWGGIKSSVYGVSAEASAQHSD